MLTAGAMPERANDRSPLTSSQLAGAILGGALVGFARPRHGGFASATRLAGLGLVAAALTPALSRKVLRAGAARRRVHLLTTVVIERSVRDVFAFCKDFENFPRVVHALRCVTDYQDGRSRWEVCSPSGEVLAWDVVVTKYVPNVVIGWSSTEGSVVDCSGLIRFAPISDHATRLDVHVRYDPCHTGFADAIRALVDVRGEDALKADLERASSYLQARWTSSDANESEEGGVDSLTA